MSFAQPFNLLYGIFLAVIAIFYLRKKQAAEYRVSWIKMWDEAIVEEAGLNVSRLRQNLLLAMQLACALMLVLSSAKPLLTRGEQEKRVVIALDGSISMNARENGVTRFEEAKAAAQEYIKALPANAAVSLLLLKNGAEEYVRDAEKSRAQKALQGLTCTSDSLDAQKVAAVLETYPGEKVVFTDKDLGFGTTSIKIGGRLDDAGITGASFDYYSRTLLCRLKNYSDKDKTIAVKAEDDRGEKIIGRAYVPSGGEQYISFELDRIPDMVRLSIIGTDMLAEDDSYVLPLGDEYKTKVVMIGENPYMKAALQSMAEIHFEKAKSFDDIKKTFDIFVLAQKQGPVHLPEECGVWKLYPDENDCGVAFDHAVPLQPGNSSISSGLALAGIYADKGLFLKQKDSFKSVLLADGRPVMICGDENGRRQIISSIDFSKTNMVMTPAFPVLVHRSIKWLSEGMAKSFEANPPQTFVTGAEFLDRKGAARKGAAGMNPVARDVGRMFALTAMVFMALELEVYRREL
ncbi:MAG: hypothetical protein PWQ97_398 [Tepidanaerobacteraceae bacterium]|nr:hypothetical protein [Tepidanaerobacteraceae bacterium]